MNSKSITALLGAVLLAGGPAQASVTEDFENGNPDNWAMDWNGTYNGFAINEIAGTVQTTGGNPGGYMEFLQLSAQFDVWFFHPANGTPDWTGDYRAKAVDEFTFDFRYDNAGGAPFGMCLNLVLCDDMGTPEVTDDYMAVAPYDPLTHSFAGFGAAIPAGSWTAVSFPIDSASTTIPTGWTIQGLGGTYGSGDDDADWNAIITDVDYVAVVNGNPWGGFTLGFGDWKFDNMHLNTSEPGVPYCFGDGSGAPCPCGNDNDGSVADAGCANGQYASGARLYAGGSASLANDTLVLYGEFTEHNQFGLYFQADNDLSPGTAWGDGLRCAGGNLKRLGTRISNASGSSDTSGFAYTISSKAGNTTAGVTKYYQLWYRNPLASPCSNDFNTSNGLAIVWQP